MRVFGLEISRARQVPANLSPALGGGGWFPIIREPFTGAWQTNQEITAPSALAYFAVYGCVTLIATDIGKLCLRLVAKTDDGIWEETENVAYSPVLRKPNRYQTIVKFVEQWITSKLTAGNAYVLKERDGRGVVSALYVLDPSRVTPLVAPDGAVYYGLKSNHLAGLTDAGTHDLIVPAREIIHDAMVTLFHPLVGVTPLYACGLAAQHGLTIQAKSEQFFRGGSHPGGVLTAPGEIGDDQAQRIKKYWEENFSGANVGRVAVVGKGLKYEAMTVSAADAQLIEQLNWTAQQICTAFHVPPALLDLGAASNITDLEPLLQKYHAQCIQSLLTNFETSLDDGLELKSPYGTEFDVDDLIWMATATKTKAAAEAIGAGALAPDEARKKWFGLGKVKGGNTPYMQQQNYSLAALAERDADQPFTKPAPAVPPSLPPAPAVDDDADEKAFLETLNKSLMGLYAA